MTHEKSFHQPAVHLYRFPHQPVFRGEKVEAPPPLILGVAAVAVVVALLSGSRKPVADIGRTSKNCFWKKYKSVTTKTSNSLLHVS